MNRTISVSSRLIFNIILFIYSFKKGSRTVSRVLLSSVIYLDLPSPANSERFTPRHRTGSPTCAGVHNLSTHQSYCPLHSCRGGRLLPCLFTLTGIEVGGRFLLRCFAIADIFPLGRMVALCCPDFPPAAEATSDRPSCCQSAKVQKNKTSHRFFYLYFCKRQQRRRQKRERFTVVWRDAMLSDSLAMSGCGVAFVVAPAIHGILGV